MRPYLYANSPATGLAMPDVRVKIDVNSGLIELEGEKEFVSSYLDRLLPMVEAAKFGAGHSGKPPGTEDEDLPLVPPNGGITEDAAVKQAKRRVPRRPPSGASCRDRILVLKKEGFFKEHRSPTDIVKGLAKKGWTYKGNQVSAALTTMFSSTGEIQRTAASQGRGFVYFWDRN